MSKLSWGNSKTHSFISTWQKHFLSLHWHYFAPLEWNRKKQLLDLIEKLNACHSLIWLKTLREWHRISQSHRLCKGRKISFQLQAIVETLTRETFTTTNWLILNLCIIPFTQSFHLKEICTKKAKLNKQLLLNIGYQSQFINNQFEGFTIGWQRIFLKTNCKLNKRKECCSLLTSTKCQQNKDWHLPDTNSDFQKLSRQETNISSQEKKTSLQPTGSTKKINTVTRKT